MAWGGQHDVYELQKSQKISQLTLADLLDSHELVWRSCIVDGIPSLLPSLRAKDYPDRIQGRLSVIVVRADGLSKPALTTSIRPYVVLEVGNMELRSSKKKTTSAGAATWNEIFEFPIDFDIDETPKDNEDYLIVNVFHKYYRLGRCLIAIKELSSIYHSGRKFNLPPVPLNDAVPIVSTTSSWYPLGKNEFLTDSAGFIQLEFSFAPGIEEEPHLVRWQPDTDLVACPLCNNKFTIFLRKHHCRKCGSLVCGECSQGRMIITRNNTNARKRNESGTKAVRVCDSCEPNKSMRNLMEKERAADQLARIRTLSTWEPVDKTRNQITPNASEEEDSDEKSPNAENQVALRMGASYALDLDSNKEAYICECGRVCTLDSETNLRDFAARMRDTGEMPPLPTGSPRERWAWVSSVMGLKDSIDFNASRISLPEPPSESPARSRHSAEGSEIVEGPPSGPRSSPLIPPPSRSPTKRKPTIVKLNFGQICVCGRVIISATRHANRNRLSSVPLLPTRNRSTLSSTYSSSPYVTHSYLSPSLLSSTTPAPTMVVSPSNLPFSSAASSSPPFSYSSPLASSFSSTATTNATSSNTTNTNNNLVVSTSAPPSSSSSSSSSSFSVCSPSSSSSSSSSASSSSFASACSSFASPSSSPSCLSSSTSTFTPRRPTPPSCSSSPASFSPSPLNSALLSSSPFLNNNNNNNNNDSSTSHSNRLRSIESKSPSLVAIRSPTSPTHSASVGFSPTVAPLTLGSASPQRPKRTMPNTTTSSFSSPSPSPRPGSPPDNVPSGSLSARTEYVPDGRGSFTMASPKPLAGSGKSPPPPPSALQEAAKPLKPLRPAKGQGDEAIIEPGRAKKAPYATLGATPAPHAYVPMARHSKKQSLPPEPDGGPERLGQYRKDSEQVLPPTWSPLALDKTSKR